MTTAHDPELTKAADDLNGSCLPVTLPEPEIAAAHPGGRPMIVFDAAKKVYEQNQLLPNRTAFENVAYALEDGHLMRDERRGGYVNR